MKKDNIILIIEKTILAILFVVILIMIGQQVCDAFVESQTYEWLTFEDCIRYKGIGMLFVTDAIILIAHELIDLGLSMPDDEQDEITV